MNYKKLFSLFLFVAVGILNAQECVYWHDYKLSNAGTIIVSNCLEEQSAEYAKAKEKDHDAMGVVLAKDRVVFQKKGTNAKYPNIEINHTFISVSTKMMNPGAFPKINSDKLFSDTELKVFANQIKEVNSSNPNLQIISNDPVKQIKIRDQNAIKISFTSKIRNINDEPSKTIIYMIPNYDRLHSININYLISEEEKWGPIFQHMVNNLYIAYRNGDNFNLTP